MQTMAGVRVLEIAEHSFVHAALLVHAVYRVFEAWGAGRK
jgi:hypothetical protein